MNFLRKVSHIRGWLHKPHPKWDLAIWVEPPNILHRLWALDCRSTNEPRPEPTAVRVAGCWVKAETSLGLAMLTQLRDGTERAVQTGHSQNRPRRGLPYVVPMGLRLGKWGRGYEQNLPRNVANAARLMTGEYPKTRIDAVRALAHARDGGPFFDETGCIFRR